jgi:hypothetical protein
LAASDRARGYIREGDQYIQYGAWDVALNYEEQVGAKLAEAAERLDEVAEHRVQDDLDRAAIAGDMGYLLAVVFGGVTEAATAELRATLALENVQVVLLTGALAEALVADYSSGAEGRSRPRQDGFSFAELRQHVRAQVATEPWRQHFQTTSI